MKFPISASQEDSGRIPHYSFTSESCTGLKVSSLTQDKIYLNLNRKDQFVFFKVNYFHKNATINCETYNVKIGHT